MWFKRGKAVHAFMASTLTRVGSPGGASSTPGAISSSGSTAPADATDAEPETPVASAAPAACLIFFACATAPTCQELQRCPSMKWPMNNQNLMHYSARGSFLIKRFASGLRHPRKHMPHQLSSRARRKL